MMITAKEARFAAAWLAFITLNAPSHASSLQIVPFTSIGDASGKGSIRIFSRDEISRQPNFLSAPRSQVQDVPISTRAALAYLSANAEIFQIQPDLSALREEYTKVSLLGSTVKFVQTINGRDIDRSSVSVFLNNDYRITKTVNNLIPTSTDKAIRANNPSVSEAQALDTAWKLLSPKAGEWALLGEPNVRLVYLDTPNQYRLVYKVLLYVTRDTVSGTGIPGLWEIEIDAVDGSVAAGPTDLTVREGKASGDETYLQGQGADRLSAFSTYYARAASKQGNSAELLQTGSGLIFEPDPATFLAESKLSKDDPTTKFDSAYQKKPLYVIKRDNLFYPENSSAKIEDFEPPKDPPSTSSDGNWIAKRGDNAFNDVMAIYYIDLSQKYLQSLGYVDARAIQGSPISVDTDGLSGADNSHYIPIINKLAFGHGCVPDPEDASVILHEYGHAIIYAIEPSWGGGDSGAIGEGFSDYWASSFKWLTKNGSSFQSRRVFNWDASSSCWLGRSTDKKSLQYDANKLYTAHMPIDSSNNQSDELWSFPLMQTFIDLGGNSNAKNDLDKILIEAMHGIGFGAKMRDLAAVTVATAATLFPNGPHAIALQKNFETNAILDKKIVQIVN